MLNRKYILTKGKAGLGNRILCLLGSILYARISQRDLIVDWSDPLYSSDGSDSFSRFFEAPNSVPLSQAITAGSVAPAIWRNALHRSVDEYMTEREGSEDADLDPRINAEYTIDMRRTIYPEQLLVRWSYLDDVDSLRGHFGGMYEPLSNMTSEDILREVVRENLVPHREIRERALDFKRHNFVETTIGLHIRQSDRRNSFARYPVLIDKIMRNHPRAAIFLATDNKDVEAYFRSRYERVLVTKKWLPEPGVPIHRTRGCPDKFSLGVEALVDMYLLSACAHLIYNRTSTFGYCANLISPAPKENRIDTAPVLMTKFKGAWKWMARKLAG